MDNTIKINYYDKFRCLAGECPYTCCQEWSIAIDLETLQKWQGAKLGESALCDCLTREDGLHVISLQEDSKCPLLSEKKLCKLVVELGEEYLSETCCNYPRLINEYEDRTEYGLDFGCPAVIDLVNEHLGAVEFEQKGTKKYKSSPLYLVREMMIDIIKNENYCVTERLMIIFCSLLGMLEEKELTKETIDNHKSKEYLDSVANAIRGMNFSVINSFWERNEVFLDLIQVYRDQKLYKNYLGKIATLAERLEDDYSDEMLLEANEAFEVQYAAYEKLLESYLVAEIFHNTLDGEMELRDMVMVFQWGTLVYSAIKQAIFLDWILQDKKAIDYAMIKENMMMISRMAGYSKNDIKEYLENSFESVIWEWGYLALIVGNSKL